jgi:hypothetical protein
MCFDSLSSQYLSFLLHSFSPEKGRFRNFLTYTRQWTEEVGSEDAHGRALWGIGKAVAFLDDPGQMAMSMTLFNKAMKAVEHFESPRAIAFALVGIHAYPVKRAEFEKSLRTGFSINSIISQQKVGPGWKTL